MVAHRAVVADRDAFVVAVCFAGVRVEQLVAVRHTVEAGVAAVSYTHLTLPTT